MVNGIAAVSLLVLTFSIQMAVCGEDSKPHDRSIVIGKKSLNKSCSTERPATVAVEMHWKNKTKTLNATFGSHDLGNGLMLITSDCSTSNKSCIHAILNNTGSHATKLSMDCLRQFSISNSSGLSNRPKLWEIEVIILPEPKFNSPRIRLVAISCDKDGQEIKELQSPHILNAETYRGFGAERYWTVNRRRLTNFSPTFIKDSGNHLLLTGNETSVYAVERVIRLFNASNNDTIYERKFPYTVTYLKNPPKASSDNKPKSTVPAWISFITTFAILFIILFTAIVSNNR